MIRVDPEGARRDQDRAAQDHRVCAGARREDRQPGRQVGWSERAVEDVLYPSQEAELVLRGHVNTGTWRHGSRRYECMRWRSWSLGQGLNRGWEPYRAAFGWNCDSRGAGYGMRLSCLREARGYSVCTLGIIH
jgi:hypothetical protein